MNYIINPAVTYRKYLKSVIINDQLTLNETAAFIFLSFESDNNYENILADFENNFKVENESYREEIASFIKELFENQLLVEK